MIPLPIVFLVLLICLLYAFSLGWNTAIARHRASRHRLETAVADVELQAAAITAGMAVDPMRAGIDAGKSYAIGQVQQTIDRLRKEMPR